MSSLGCNLGWKEIFQLSVRCFIPIYPGLTHDTTKASFLGLRFHGRCHHSPRITPWVCCWLITPWVCCWLWRARALVHRVGLVLAATGCRGESAEGRWGGSLAPLTKGATLAFTSAFTRGSDRSLTPRWLRWCSLYQGGPGWCPGHWEWRSRRCIPSGGGPGIRGRTRGGWHRCLGDSPRVGRLSRWRRGAHPPVDLDTQVWFLGPVRLPALGWPSALGNLGTMGGPSASAPHCIVLLRPRALPGGCPGRLPRWRSALSPSHRWRPCSHQGSAPPRYRYVYIYIFFLTYINKFEYRMYIYMLSIQNLHIYIY